MPFPSRNHSEPVASRRRLLKLGAASAGLAAFGLLGCRGESGGDAPGQRFPMFRLAELDGAVRDSRDYAGKALLVNFWASWCPPCRAEMADLQTLHRQLGGRGLQVLAISLDEDLNLAKEYVRQAGLDFTVLIDAGQLSKQLHLAGLPTTYLIGRDGLIKAVWLGPRAWATPELQADIALRADLG